MPHMCVGNHRGQKRVELQPVMICLIMGIKLGSSASVASALNCWPISPAPRILTKAFQNCPSAGALGVAAGLRQVTAKEDGGRHQGFSFDHHGPCLLR